MNFQSFMSVPQYSSFMVESTLFNSHTSIAFKAFMPKNAGVS